ncbi:MAG TPA: HD domain-containing protein [Nitrososphaera sp.]|nr:HD domain-containing protein [Nitrososphaera sp.]
MEQQGFNDFTKASFARLLKHFEDNTDNIVKLTRAFALATKAHKDHFMDNNEPHVNHSLRTALILADELHMYDVNVASAALLHDALQGVQEQEIREECGDRVAEIVQAVAEPRLKQQGIGGSGATISEKERGKILDNYFAKLAKSPKEARCVKLADRLDTARSMKTYAYRESALRFKEETQKYAVPLAQATDERLAFKLSVALYEIK